MLSPNTVCFQLVADSTILASLLWLHVKSRIEYKILPSTYKDLYNQTPSHGTSWYQIIPVEHFLNHSIIHVAHPSVSSTSLGSEHKHDL